MKRKTLAIVAGAAAVALLALVAASASAAGSAADKYAVINGTANAATDHEIAATTAFPNYTTGAVDNYYTLAHSYVDNSPFAEGTASPADTGPIGQTAAAGHFAQPQYADARWPGNNGKASYGKSGGPSAVAAASSFKATASSSEASNGSSGGSARALAVPKGFAHRLQLALAAWKATWDVRLHLKLKPKSPAPPAARRHRRKPPVSVPPVTVPGTTVPTTTVPTSTLPGVTVPGTTIPRPTPEPVSLKRNSRSLSASSGNSGSALASTSEAELDSTGKLVTSGESSLGSVSIGGQILIQSIDVSAEIDNSGTPTSKVAVNIGNASVGGVPVTIDQNGVHIKGQGGALPYAKADSALNGALKKAGVQLYTVQPEIVKSPNAETITATGVDVVFDQPVQQSGVPSQSFEHILGEVYVDSLAVPGTPVPNLGLSGGSTPPPVAGSTTPPVTSSTGGSTGFSSGGAGTGTSSYGSSGTSSSSGVSSQPASGSSQSSTVPAALVSILHKPLWLLIAYLVWQALLAGTGFSIYRWRRAAAL